MSANGRMIVAALVAGLAAVPTAASEPDADFVAEQVYELSDVLVCQGKGALGTLLTFAASKNAAILAKAVEGGTPEACADISDRAWSKLMEFDDIAKNGARCFRASGFTFKATVTVYVGTESPLPSDDDPRSWNVVQGRKWETGSRSGRKNDVFVLTKRKVFLLRKHYHSRSQGISAAMLKICT